MGMTSLLLAQSAADSITMKKAPLGGYQFIYRGDNLRTKEVVQVMDLNKTACVQMKSARTSNSIANDLSFAGSFMVGWTLGDLAGGRDPNYAVMALGGGLIVTSIPFTVSAVKKSKKAVHTWNSGLSTSSLPPARELDFTMRGLGVGLVYRF